MDIFYDNGNLNKNKLRETWLRKNSILLYDKIIEFKFNNNLPDLKFSNIVYLYINNINVIPLCEWCNNSEKRFMGYSIGYDKFCSKKCASAKSRPQVELNRKKNCLTKWGVDHTSKLESVKEKQKKTNIEKWGFVSPTLNNDVREKQKKTMIKKWGVEYSGLNKKLLDKSLNTRFEKYINDVKNRYPNFKIEIEKEGLFLINCDKCNKRYEINSYLFRLRLLRYKVNTCLHCNPIQSYGKFNENEICEVLDSLEINYIRGDRKVLNGKELDIYLPDYSLAIEFNGLWWHSESNKDKSYHLDKKNRCEELGINLIHIWEDDWLSKKDIVVSRLKSLLLLNNQKIWARKCIIKEIESKKSFEFLEVNHLQGGINSSIKYGLYYNDELVSVMTFGKSRISLGHKNNKWELYRFCSLLNTSVIGSFSKMLNRFINDYNPNEILTYANRDWSLIKNNVYLNNKFKYEGTTNINYWYFKNTSKRYHRFSFRKDKLIKMGYDPNKTEKEIMFENGWNCIWDCGNLKFTWKP